MKALLILLLSVLSLPAATIDIPGTQYRFEYESKTWDLISSGDAKGLWSFSDHLLYLGGSVICMTSENPYELDAKNLAKSMGDSYGQPEEVIPVAELKTLKFSNSKEKKTLWISYQVEEKYVLFICVEGDSFAMASRKPTVLSFLSGLKRKTDASP